MKKEEKFTYSKYLSYINSDKSKDKNSIFDVINLDVARTYFDYKADETRKVSLLNFRLFRMY